MIQYVTIKRNVRADKIKDTEKIKRKIWEKYSQAMKRIPSK